MPRKCLTIIADLCIKAITAPGVWLPCKQDIYLSLSLFGQYKCTRLLDAWFPMHVNERFRFDKTYYSASDPSEVADFLEDELLVMELVQLSDLNHGAIRLATFSCDARTFLYPDSTYLPTYCPSESEVLMHRSAHFPGIAPKIEYTCRTVIRRPEDLELADLEDAIAQERLALSELKKSVRSLSRSSRNRSRSRSRQRDLDIYDLRASNNIRPPFVVRKTDKDLTSRRPGSAPPESFIKQSKSRARSRSRSRSRCDLASDDSDDWAMAHAVSGSNVVKEVVRDPGLSPRPIYSSKPTLTESADDEVERLLTKPSYSPPPRYRYTPHAYTPPPRPRSISPVVLRSSLRDRLSPYVSPRPYTSLTRSPISLKGTSSCRDSLDELARDFAIAENRRYLY